MLIWNRKAVKAIMIIWEKRKAMPAKKERKVVKAIMIIWERKERQERKVEKETDGPTNCPGSRCSLICLLYKVIIMMLLLVEKRAKRKIKVKNVKILWLNSVFPQPLFSLSVVSYFYCPVVLLELVSGTVSTRSSFFSFFSEKFFGRLCIDGGSTCYVLHSCCALHLKIP